jgi:hypothetical protein
LVEARGIEPRSQDALRTLLRAYSSDLQHQSGNRDDPATPNFNGKILAVSLPMDDPEQPAENKPEQPSRQRVERTRLPNKLGSQSVVAVVGN